MAYRTWYRKRSYQKANKEAKDLKSMGKKVKVVRYYAVRVKD